jgi:hypothetical protein
MLVGKNGGQNMRVNDPMAMDRTGATGNGILIGRAVLAGRRAP